MLPQTATFQDDLRVSTVRVAMIASGGIAHEATCEIEIDPETDVTGGAGTVPGLPRLLDDFLLGAPQSTVESLDRHRYEKNMIVPREVELPPGETGTATCNVIGTAYPCGTEIANETKTVISRPPRQVFLTEIETNHHATSSGISHLLAQQTVILIGTENAIETEAGTGAVAIFVAGMTLPDLILGIVLTSTLDAPVGLVLHPARLTGRPCELVLPEP
ncbi:hypothetical protein CFO_g4666 [Ceratocystis platani]|uniref:Uncharacterized protein n=1 Tax=Ceratocystis fimbriata f. sp. platani TaxID=88771 RepID=A0A0F8AXT2_CERFI|nr:hypothetical protein CFO_g4666 [Ceratocystis platani]